MPRLALSPRFPAELGALAQPVRRDAVVAVRRFLQNTSGGPHPERVRGARDDRVATLRLADRHRGVVIRQRDVYWLLTVLPDAEAWAYAQRLRFGVNPVLGVAELWDAAALERVEPAVRRAAAASRARLFAQVCDTDLGELGIDHRFLPLLRQITDELTLEALEPLLPPTQYAPLAALARGESVAGAWRELENHRAVAGTGPIGPEELDDLAAALRRSPDRAVFVDGPRELNHVLDAPGWCVFLHPPQHRLAHWDSYDRPLLVTGGAGTGKTLVALHRAAHLARNGSGPVLLVAFSQGLSADLSARLDLLIEDEVVRKRVEVGNVDRLAHRIVAEAEDRPPSLVGSGELTALWREASGEYGPAFLLREWEQVILAQNLRTLDEYLAAPRAGRAVDLSAEQRTAVWQAVGHVTGRLAERGRRTLLQLAAEAATLLGQTTGDLLEEAEPRREPYRHIVVDEAQDLHPTQWRLLRAAVPYAPDDLFIVGDPHQRVFDTRVALGTVGIDADQRLLQVSYRLPQEILSWGVRLRGGGPADGLVAGVQELYGFRSMRHGPRPMVRAYGSPQDELSGLAAHVAQWLQDGVPPGEIGVAARTAELVRDARAALRETGVRVTTLHGMKGLEFRRVAVIGVSDGIVPAPDSLTPAGEDPSARAHDLQRERGLLYVACTRAEEVLYVSYSGRASPFLPT
ncbi:UvrD-helicase domain-containing protein [Planomonospora venezuelensis]|uniref:DNA 3'-5' helicase n=1 Tax=Planomonospora venezuelensis TaxID=1999 RepID=A0A841D3Y4_PLAVE|nr:UvrD-helicase domain-containing protein [Planomonospora venezuelensis]MBB5962875.1 superfamily I DNA/RNA helicase [Planomonospora venezuelensis]GIN05335.1 DNA helicase [Planomonospora venezuelensis]